MRTLVHLSDLHFGRVDEKLIAPLIARIAHAEPDVVVVSGDLTQRARSAEFAAAKQFLDALPKPQVVVPGNHDIPLHNIFNRFLRPLDKYRRAIDNDLEPAFVDEEIAVFGLNTARSLTIKDGRVNQVQMAQLQARLASLDPALTRVIVTHHPFDLPSQYDRSELVGRAPAAMHMLAECRVDLLLAGHLHVSHAIDSAARYPMSGYASLVVQAGTATSTRGRGEANSFNIIRIATSNITVERQTWDDASGGFLCFETEAFERRGEVWSRQGATSAT